MTQPYYPNLDGKTDYDVAQGIRTAYDYIHKLTARVAQLESAGYVTRDQAFTHLGPKAMRQQLQVTGGAPLNVTGLTGQLAQPQIADAPTVTSLPPITDPLSQDGTLVSLSDRVYRFDGTTDPGTWVPITAGPAPSTAVTSLDTLTGDITLVAGTNITITDNSPSAGDIKIDASGAGSGGLVPLEQHTIISSTATMDFTSFISTSYDVYVFELINFVPVAGNAVFEVLASTDGGSTYITSLYRYAGHGRTGTGSDMTYSSNGAAYGELAWFTGTGGINGRIELYNPSSTTYNKALTSHFSGSTNDGGVGFWNGGVFVYTSSAVNAIRFQFDTGNISNGIGRCYGIVKS